MTDGRKTYAQLLVEERTGRDLLEVLRDLYVDKRHSQREIAAALSAKGAPVSRALVSEWLRDLGITRDDRPAVAL
jgi:arginine repressor